jgi:hypothetical protein
VATEDFFVLFDVVPLDHAIAAVTSSPDRLCGLAADIGPTVLWAVTVATTISASIATVTVVVPTAAVIIPTTAVIVPTTSVVIPATVVVVSLLVGVIHTAGVVRAGMGGNRIETLWVRGRGVIRT